MIIHYNCTIGSILLHSFLLIYHPYPSSFFLIFNPRRACAARLVCVCSLIFFNRAQQSGKIAILTGSGLHGLDFKNGDFRKITAFKSYGVKTK